MSDIKVTFTDQMPEVNMCWECPQCGSQVGQADSPTAIVTIHPPTCQFGHAATEMEQRSASAFRKEGPS